MTSKRVAVAFGATVLGALALTGCGDPAGSAPRGEVVEGEGRIITFPQGYGNVAAKCDGPNMVYVAEDDDHASSTVSVVPNDARCK